MLADQLLESTLRRDRLLVLGSVVLVTALAWLYLIDMAADMDAMSGGMSMAMSGAMMAASWSISYAAIMFGMWTIMMVGMMVPSAAPVILLHARVWRRRRLEGRAYAPTAAFAGGYLAAWTAFSAAATALQWGLEAVALLSPMMVSASPVLGGAVLMAAGVYQLTPLKQACLRHCRSPLEFLSRRWRRGAGGAFRMGVEHGVYCLGCCWMLMALLFVGGVMNLLWVAAITLFVLVEKLVPAGRGPGHLSALAMMAAGALFIVTA